MSEPPVVPVRSLRILILNQYFPPDSARTAGLVAEIVEDLSKSHGVVVIAGQPSYSPGAYVPEEPTATILRTRSAAFARKSLAARALNYAGYLAGAFFRMLRVPKPDVIVAFSDPPFVGFIGTLGSMLRRAPLVQVYMDLYPDIAVALGHADHPAFVWMWRLMNKLVRWRAARLVVVGRDMRDRLLQQGVPAAKIVVVPNWADDLDFSDDEVVDARREMGWEGRFVVMFGGNLGLAQGLSAVVDAAALLRDDAQIDFVLVGDGAAKASLEERARGLALRNVTFLPYRPRREAELLVRAADVQLITLAPGLLGTATPGKVYGAMAASKPFIAAVEPGSEIDLLVQEYSCGVRVDPLDGGAVADRILALRAGESLEEMGRRGRRAFESSFTRSVATERYQILLEEVASGSGQALERGAT